MPNRDFNKIQTWSVKWKITFNPAKSEDVSPPPPKCTFIVVPPVKLVGSVIERVNNQKHLGVYIYFDLSWKKQIPGADRKLAVLRSEVRYSRCVIHTESQMIENCLQFIWVLWIKLSFGARQYISKKNINVDFGWESGAERYNILGLSLFHKVHIGDKRPLIKPARSEAKRGLFTN